MPINPVAFQATIQNTQAVSAQKGADDARPAINQQNLTITVSKDAEQARRDALKGAQNDVANLSIEIASKLIHKELNADDQKALIDSYIA